MFNISKQEVFHPNCLNSGLTGNSFTKMNPKQFFDLSQRYTLTPFHTENISFVEKFVIHKLPAVIEAADQYREIRSISGRLTILSKQNETKFISEIEGFTSLNVDASTLEDVDTGKRLIKRSYVAAEAIELQANHVTTYYKYQVGKLACVFKALVKKHKLGNWKEQFNQYFPDLSYETVNNWKNVATIPKIENWLFLNIWKLKLLRSAYTRLEINSNDPIKCLSKRLGVHLTEDITEKQLKALVDREKFKNLLADNNVDLDESFVDSLATIKDIKLNEQLLQQFKDIQETGGCTSSKATKLIANKGLVSPIKKFRKIPDQLAFDEQTGPLLTLFDLLLKTPPEEVNLEFELLDQLIKKSVEMDRHFSRNIFHKQA